MSENSSVPIQDLEQEKADVNSTEAVEKIDNSPEAEES